MSFLTVKKLAVAVVAASVITACQSTQDKVADVPLDSGIILANLDTQVRPQDNFFEFVNGSWLAQAEIPTDKSSTGTFMRLREEADANVRKIIEQAGTKNGLPDSPEGKIGLMYNSFMNEAHVEALGTTPLDKDLARIDKIDSVDGILRWTAWANRYGIDSPLGLYVMPDYKDPTIYRAYISQWGLGLPNSDYYSDDSEKGQSIIAAYKKYTTGIFKALGYSDSGAKKAAEKTYALEKQLAAANRPPVEDREYTRHYNLFGPGHATLPEGVNWQVFLNAMDVEDNTVFAVAQPEYLPGLAKALSNTPVTVWRDYMKLRLASASAPYLNKDMQKLAFDFYSRTLHGVPEMRPRWKRGVSLVNETLGEAVGQIYVKEHFPPKAKERMDELVSNLIEAYRQSIESLEWMSEETRKNALVKLAKFTPQIGYPVKWMDYSSMDLSDSLMGNVRAASLWESNRQLARLGKKVDREEWFMAPQVVNAYYYSLNNSITFPAAILQPPFFDLNADDAVNYGAIGSVIGHEIGHGFDDNGAQFDGDGRLHNWWTESDKTAFEDRTAKLIEQFNKFEVLPGVHVNGKFTQGENIGDLAGVSISYKAYINSLDGKEAPVLDGYTGPQRFFIGYGQAWLSKARDERKRQLIKIDVHSPPQFRVNGVLPNIDGFENAFEVKPGDKMYLPPNERVRIW